MAEDSGTQAAVPVPPPEAAPQQPSDSGAAASLPAASSATPSDTASAELPVISTAQVEPQTAQIPGDEPLAPDNAAPMHAPREPLPASTATIPEERAQIPDPVIEPSTNATAPAVPSARELLVKARTTIQDRKRKKLERILEALMTREKITNDEVEKLLHVSDATATRYLTILEKEGKIRQIGKTGKHVEYAKI